MELNNFESTAKKYKDEMMKLYNKKAVSYEEKYPEPILPDFITAYKEEVPMEEGGTGYFRAEVTTGDSGIPIEGAVVMVILIEEGKKHLLHVLITDENGQTTTEELPAPSKSLSMNPDNKDVFSVYNIRVLKEGFYEVLSESAPIFDGVTSLQRVNLVPLPFKTSDIGEIVYENTEPDL